MMMMMTTAVYLWLGAGEVVVRSDAVVELDEEVGEVTLELPLVQLRLNPCCGTHGTSCVVCKPHP